MYRLVPIHQRHTLPRCDMDKKKRFATKMGQRQSRDRTVTHKSVSKNLPGGVVVVGFGVVAVVVVGLKVGP